ncbi:XRE family transcriptional regulator [Enterobacter asburiae]|uniref:XRE family transcriptional regulator n=1 Tax=Enterobacter asburiae TaxID=61645 RepID=A0A376FEJ0_ENTAS|nr:XRE family transcriptional regulator [Enterobacter asburiae]
MTQPISLIAKSLVRERLRTGLSLAEIARRAGIAKSTLSQLESGNGNPSLETLCRFAWRWIYLSPACLNHSSLPLR